MVWVLEARRKEYFYGIRMGGFDDVCLVTTSSDCASGTKRCIAQALMSIMQNKHRRIVISTRYFDRKVSFWVVYIAAPHFIRVS